MNYARHDEVIQLRLVRSDEFLNSVGCLVDTADWGSVVSFLYYASFHAVVGLLKKAGISVKTHSEAMRLFVELYTEADAISDNHGKLYARLYKERDRSDHQDFAVFTADDVLPLVPQTEAFISQIKGLINKD